MKKVLIVLALAAAASFAVDSVRIEGITIPGTDETLQYDDGTFKYYWYNAPAYGVWFNALDFTSACGGFEVESVEWWFYHSSSKPWDTDEATLELWTSNEDNSAPGEKKKEDVLTVESVKAAIVTYDPPITLPRDFWAVFNASAHSSTGCPCPLSDGTTNFTDEPHSFTPDTTGLWDPIVNGDDEPLDFCVRISGNFAEALDDESWGTIKGLYR